MATEASSEKKDLVDRAVEAANYAVKISKRLKNLALSRNLPDLPQMRVLDYRYLDVGSYYEIHYIKRSEYWRGENRQIMRVRDLRRFVMIVIIPPQDVDYLTACAYMANKGAFLFIKEDRGAILCELVHGEIERSIEPNIGEMTEHASYVNNAIEATRQEKRKQDAYKSMENESGKNIMRIMDNVSKNMPPRDIDTVVEESYSIGGIITDTIDLRDGRAITLELMSGSSIFIKIPPQMTEGVLQIAIENKMVFVYYGSRFRTQNMAGRWCLFFQNEYEASKRFRLGQDVPNLESLSDGRYTVTGVNYQFSTSTSIGVNLSLVKDGQRANVTCYDVDASSLLKLANALHEEVTLTDGKLRTSKGLDYAQSRPAPFITETQTNSKNV